MNRQYSDFNGDEVVLSIIGECKTGKSMICDRFINEYNFKWKTEYRPTIRVRYVYKYIHDERKNQNIRIEIWDISGQKRLRDISKSYWRILHGIIMVYDVSNRQSFEELGKWRQEIGRNNFILLIGNKSELEEEREVSYEEGRRFAEGLGIKLVEVCAKTNDGINYAFGILVKDIVENYHSRIQEIVSSELSDRKLSKGPIISFSRKPLPILSEIICFTFKKSFLTVLLVIFSIYIIKTVLS